MCVCVCVCVGGGGVGGGRRGCLFFFFFFSLYSLGQITNRSLRKLCMVFATKPCLPVCKRHFGLWRANSADRGRRSSRPKCLAPCSLAKLIYVSMDSQHKVCGLFPQAKLASVFRDDRTAATTNNGVQNCPQEGTTEYRTVNQQIKKGSKKAKEDLIGEQCENIEDSLKKNNSKRAYHLVKHLTSIKQERTTTIQDTSGTCLTEMKMS